MLRVLSVAVTVISCAIWYALVLLVVVQMLVWLVCLLGMAGEALMHRIWRSRR